MTSDDILTACCTPAHLSIGTVADNNRDRDERRRGANGYTRNPPKACRNGHPYPESREKPHPKTGKARCRICHNEQSNRSARRMRRLRSAAA